MILASKVQLLAAAGRGSLEIREAELSYWLTALSRLGTVSALLCGLGVSLTAIDNEAGSHFHLSYLIVSNAALGFSLTVVSICTACVIWGPSRCLRGAGNATYEQSLGVLEIAHERSVTLFEFSLSLYGVSCGLLILNTFTFFFAIPICLAQVPLFRYLRRRVRLLNQKFHPEAAVSGKNRNPTAAGKLRGWGLAGDDIGRRLNAADPLLDSGFVDARLTASS